MTNLYSLFNCSLLYFIFGYLKVLLKQLAVFIIVAVFCRYIDLCTAGITAPVHVFKVATALSKRV